MVLGAVKRSRSGYHPASLPLDSLVGSLAARPIASLRWSGDGFELPVPRQIRLRNRSFADSLLGIRTSSTAAREAGISEASQKSRVALAPVRVMLAAACTAVGDGVANGAGRGLRRHRGRGLSFGGSGKPCA